MHQIIFVHDPERNKNSIPTSTSFEHTLLKCEGHYDPLKVMYEKKDITQAGIKSKQGQRPSKE